MIGKDSLRRTCRLKDYSYKDDNVYLMTVLGQRILFRTISAPHRLSATFFTEKITENAMKKTRVEYETYSKLSWTVLRTLQNGTS